MIVGRKTQKQKEERLQMAIEAEAAKEREKAQRCVIQHTLSNTITRGMVLEQSSTGVPKTIPLIDLVPPEAVGKRGTYTITIEFEENKT